jgi:hypothetical protein
MILIKFKFRKLLNAIFKKIGYSRESRNFRQNLTNILSIRLIRES